MWKHDLMKELDCVHFSFLNCSYLHNRQFSTLFSACIIIHKVSETTWSMWWTNIFSNMLRFGRYTRTNKYIHRHTYLRIYTYIFEIFLQSVKWEQKNLMLKSLQVKWEQKNLMLKSLQVNWAIKLACMLNGRLEIIKTLSFDKHFLNAYHVTWGRDREDKGNIKWAGLPHNLIMTKTCKQRMRRHKNCSWTGITQVLRHQLKLCPRAGHFSREKV